jgi:hypothetical protein
MAVCLLESEEEDEDQTGSNDMSEKNRQLESKEAAVKLLARVPSLRPRSQGRAFL